MTLPYVMPVLRSVLFVVGGLLLAAITGQSLDESAKWWPVLCIVVNVVTIAALALVSRREGLVYSDLIDYRKGQLGLKRLSIIAVSMMAIGVGGLVVFGVALFGYVPTTSIQPIPVWLAVAVAVLLPLTVVFAELPLYFGYAYRRIEAKTGSKLLAMSYVVFFYALQHSFIPLLLDSKHMLFRFLSFLPLLVLLAVIYDRRKALAPLMIGHGVLDLATGIQILVSSLFPAAFEVLRQAAGR